MLYFTDHVQFLALDFGIYCYLSLLFVVTAIWGFIEYSKQDTVFV